MLSWAIILALVVLVVLAIVLLARGSSLTVGADRLLQIVRAGGILTVIVFGSFAVVSAATTLFADTVTVTFPVRTVPIEIPDGVFDLDGATATIVGGGLDHATAQLRGLSIPTRILLASGNLLSAAMIVVIALAVVRLAGSLREADAFRPGAARAAIVSAFAVFIGGGLGSILTQLGQWLVGDEALRVTSWAYHGSMEPPASLAELGWPDPAGFTLVFESWPLLIAFALGAVGVAFRAGETLRVRAEAAERDTDGLV